MDFTALASQQGIAFAMLLVAIYGAYREWWVPGARYRETVKALTEATNAQAKMHAANADIVASIPTILAELQQAKTDLERLQRQQGT